MNQPLLHADIKIPRTGLVPVKVKEPVRMRMEWQYRILLSTFNRVVS